MTPARGTQRQLDKRRAGKLPRRTLVSPRLLAPDSSGGNGDLDLLVRG
jgi:hypothetical protein